jgi:hypothetical protein
MGQVEARAERNCGGVLVAELTMNVGAQHAARRPIIRVSVPGLEQRTYLSFRARREIFFDFVEFEIRKISPFDRNDRG